ncbi:VOC family protein [Vibrio sonorensis]|uniref:VOC family protein n=1 Tax=Vibrio sonorensis TaxID=1004316 RepID=UPI0008DA3467|nr:VOC family protein [Vibrio sonorensis]
MEPRVSIITLSVSDLARSYEFYTALGLTSSQSPQDGIIFFKTRGTCLALYPAEALGKDIGGEYASKTKGFSGVTLAHNTRTQSEVDDLLQRAERLGGKIVKPAGDVFWGGYSGYFSDPDGHLWEVAYADSWQFNDDGSLVIE